jgi:hypothetical protein
MIPIISEFTDLVDYLIQSLFLLFSKIFELSCNLIECLFKIYAILIRFCAKIEYFLDSSKLFLVHSFDVFVKIFVIQYERFIQVDFHHFFKIVPYVVFILTLFYLIYSQKQVILRFFKISRSEATNRIELIENERLMHICCICGENYRTVLLMPCKHLCMCQFCYNIGYTTVTTRERDFYGLTSERDLIHKKTKCPICRSFIYNSITVYN